MAAASPRLQGDDYSWPGPGGQPPTTVDPPILAVFPRPQGPRMDRRAPRSLTVGLQASSFAPWSSVGAGLLVALGSLMAWASVSNGLVDVNAAGTNGDGRITLALAIVASLAAGISMRSSGRRWLAGSGAAFVAIFGISLFRAVDISSTHLDRGLVHAQVSVGAGLWLCLVASVIGVAASAYMLGRRSSDPAASSR